jgi:hypothetical protein
MELQNAVYIAMTLSTAALRVLELDPDSELMLRAVGFHARRVNAAQRKHTEALAQLAMETA